MDRMTNRTRSKFAAGAAAAAMAFAAACVQRPVETTTTPAASNDGAMSGTSTAATTSGGMMNHAGMGMKANLMPMSGTGVRGTVTMKHGSSQTEHMITAMIMGAPANGTHPWHVHTGRCEDAGMGTIVGNPASYPPLRADASGSATAMATVNAEMPMSQSYHINVHMSPNEMGTVVSCGNITM